MLWFLTATDSTLQIPPNDVEPRIAPSKLKNAICFATRFPLRVSKLHMKTTATKPVTFIVFQVPIPYPLMYQVVVLRC